MLQCKVSPNIRFPLVKLFFQYWKFKNKYDIVVVGFPGQKVMFLAKLLMRQPIVFDAFTSHYGGYVLDRKKWSRTSIHAKYYRFLDYWSCRLADLVLLDTQAHIDFFVNEFGLPKEKFRRIFVGTDSSVFYPRQLVPRSKKFQVHFHGTYIPLQGVEYIIQAAKLLENEDIQFNCIGRGQTYAKSRTLAEDLKLKNLNFIEPVEYTQLAEHIAGADICLGIFGDSPKTALVIPNKIFEAMAMAKPIITADTPAIHELCTDRENILLCRPADPKGLANAILELKNNDSLRHRIAGGAYELFKSCVAEKVIGAELTHIISSLSI